MNLGERTNLRNIYIFKKVPEVFLSLDYNTRQLESLPFSTGSLGIGRRRGLPGVKGTKEPWVYLKNQHLLKPQVACGN